MDHKSNSIHDSGPDAILHQETWTDGDQPGDPFIWTVEDAFAGTQVFGETGSGKTSGSGASIAKGLLKRGFGGIILTAKTTDVYDWLHPSRGFLAQAGLNPRDPNKVVVFGEAPTGDLLPPKDDRPRNIDTSRRFNFLDYEFSKTGFATFNLVQLFLTAVESGSQGNTGQEDAYWIDALRQLLTNAIELVVYATGSVSLPDILRVILTAPTSRAEAVSKRWQNGQSECWRYLEVAEQILRRNVDESKDAATAHWENFKQVVNYWMLDFAGLADRTRSVIVSTFTSKITGLTRHPLFELLCDCKVVDPRFLDIVQATRDKKIVIINLPVKRYAEVGRFAQLLIKTVWQRGIERHPDSSKPVFLWADEAQFFASREDMMFQTTARSSGCATVYLTQNICNYYAIMPGKDPKSATDALLGNLATKIFHANGDPSTNLWAQKLFGNERSRTSSESVQSSGGMQYGSSETQPVPIVQSRDFAMLRKGGTRHSGIVDALIFQTGSMNRHQKSTLVRTAFRQSVLNLKSEVESEQS